MSVRTRPAPSGFGWLTGLPLRDEGAGLPVLELRRRRWPHASGRECLLPDLVGSGARPPRDRRARGGVPWFGGGALNGEEQLGAIVDLALDDPLEGVPILRFEDVSRLAR